MSIAALPASMTRRTRSIALPTRVLTRWDAIAAAQLCQRAAELEAENEQLQRRLRWAEQLADGVHEQSATWDEDAGVEGIAMQVLA